MNIEERYQRLCNEYTNYNNEIMNDSIEDDTIICKDNIQKIESIIKKYIDKNDIIFNNITSIDKYTELLKTVNDNINNLEKSYQQIIYKNLDLNNYNPCDIPLFNIDNEKIQSYTTNEKNRINELIIELDKKKSIWIKEYNSFQDIIKNYKNLLKTSFENSEIKDIFNTNICSICYDKEITICCNPCGHTFCNDCSKKIITKCFICNANCNNKIKLFITNNMNNTNNTENNNYIESYTSNNVYHSIDNSRQLHYENISEINISEINTIGNLIRNSNLALH
jgi:hypothetical protein